MGGCSWHMGSLVVVVVGPRLGFRSLGRVGPVLGEATL